MRQRTAVTKEEKLTIILRQQEGESVYTLAKQTGYPVRELRKWIRRYRKRGEAGVENRRFSAFLLPMLLVVFAAVSAVSLIEILQVRQERAVGNEAYTNLADSVVTIQLPQSAETSVTAVEPQKEQNEAGTMENFSAAVDFDALQAINEQSVAWILSADGLINYPVVQGTDNDYYLNHLPDGTVNRNGSIFMDFRSRADLSDRNTFIYGHNMLDGAMFASLSRYSEADYRLRHPELLLLTDDGGFSLQVFAGCVVPGNSDVYQLTFKDDEDFAAYIEKIRTLSEFSVSVEVEENDRIVTLSTCAYDYEDARYVLFCKLIPMQ